MVLGITLKYIYINIDTQERLSKHNRDLPTVVEL